jgi:hypothetical protein
MANAAPAPGKKKKKAHKAPLEAEWRMDVHDAKGAEAKSLCHCRPAVDSASGCNLRSMSLTLANPVDALERSIRDHIGTVSDLRVASIADLPLSCAEHLAKDEVMGSWGGDPSELVLAMTAIEESLDKQLKPGEIKTSVRQMIGKMRAPYVVFHTNATAMLHLQRKLHLDSVDMLQPPVQLRPRIIAAFADPDTHGCVVLRMMVQRPTDFGVRLPLLLSVLQALHEILWNPSDGLRPRIRYYVHETDVQHAGAQDAGGKGGSAPVQLISAGAARAVDPQPPEGGFEQPLPYGRFTGVFARAPGGGVKLRMLPDKASPPPQPGANSIGNTGSAGGAGTAGPAVLLETQRGGHEGSALSAAPAVQWLRLAPKPAAMLEVSVQPSCWERRRTVAIAPFIPAGHPSHAQPPAHASAESAGAESSAAAAPVDHGGEQQHHPSRSFIVMHPQAVSARRNATASLLATVFKADMDMLAEAMEERGKAWSALVERELRIGNEPGQTPKAALMFT